MSFESFQLHPDLRRGVGAIGFSVPTPIQEQAIPPAMAGRDVLARAVTGSGKTAAFLLPILHGLMRRPRGVTRALVLAPTRELAVQIDDHRRGLARHAGVDGAAVYGGVAMGPQEQAFRRGADVLVATPGRLLDHLRHPYARLDRIEFLVLDEADRMLDMGFLPDIRRILGRLPSRRQTLFFSATIPPPITALARELLHEPIAINIEAPAAPASGITQSVYPVPRELKPSLLLELLRGPDVRSMLAFTRTKHRADRLAHFLARHGVAAERIHGNRSQAQRTSVLAGFKSGRFRVLVATDIAARGIDITTLSHVVNFDVPSQPEEYIHRVGRTARAGGVGAAVTLLSPEEEADFRTIERAIRTPIARATLPGFEPRERAAVGRAAPARSGGHERRRG